jgi:hypothetical protein
MTAAQDLNHTAQRAAQFQRETMQSQRRMLDHYGLGERPWPNQAPVPVTPTTVTVEELATVLLRWAQQAPTGTVDATVGNEEEREQLTLRIPDLVKDGRVRISVRS